MGLTAGYSYCTLHALVAVIKSDWPQLASVALERAEQKRQARGGPARDGPHGRTGSLVRGSGEAAPLIDTLSEGATWMDDRHEGLRS